MELVLAYPIMLTLNFTSLLVLCGYHGKRWMASILSLIVLSCLGFVFYAIKFEFFLPLSWETGLGLGGLLILLLSHGCLIWDIKGGVGLLEYAIALLNIVPPGFLNMITCYLILKKHPEQQFIAYSGLLGFCCAIVELMLLILKAIHDKFSGDNNGPALPPDPQNVAVLAQAAAASAAQVAASEARVEARLGQIAEVLARLQAAAGQQLNVENSGDELCGILVAHHAERRGGQFQSNAAQGLGSGLPEEGYELGDKNGTLNSKKDLSIRKLPALQVETTELDKKKLKQHLQSESCHGDGEAKKTEVGENESLQSESFDGDYEVKKSELGNKESQDLVMRMMT